MAQNDQPEGSAPGPMSALGGSNPATKANEKPARPPKPPREPWPADAKRNIIISTVSILGIGAILGGLIFVTAPKTETVDPFTAPEYISPKEAFESYEDSLIAADVESVVEKNPYLQDGTEDSARQGELTLSALNLLPDSFIDVTERIAIDTSMRSATSVLYSVSEPNAPELIDNVVASLSDSWSVIDTSCYEVEGKTSLTPSYGSATIVTPGSLTNSCPLLLANANAEQIALLAYSNSDPEASISDADKIVPNQDIEGIQEGNFILNLPDVGVLVVAAYMSDTGSSTTTAPEGAPAGPAPTPQAP